MNSRNMMLSVAIILVTIGASLGMQSPERSTQINDDASIGYGGECNETLTCDKYKSLNCFNGSCQCVHQASMKYDVELASCVVLAQEPCMVEAPASLSLAQRELPCGRNSVCDHATRICNCNNHFVVSGNGSCVPKSVIKEACTMSTECRDDWGLVCIEGACVCNSEISIYSNKDDFKGCVGQAEKPCIQGICTSNARCLNGTLTENDGMGPADNNSSNHDNASNETQSSTMSCKCLDGYDPTPSGSCAKDYGILCNEARSCKSWLRCGSNNTCECLNSTNQFFDENAGRCISKVGGRCNSNVSLEFEPENDICIIGAECVVKHNNILSTEDTSYHCQCKDGYLETQDGTCDLGFGGDCTGTWTSFVPPCSREANLGCDEGKCVCNSVDYAYDVEEQQCVGLAGAKCTTKILNLASRGNPELDNKIPRGNSAESQDLSSDEGPQKQIKCIKQAICDIVPQPINRDLIHVHLEGVCKCLGGTNQTNKRCEHLANSHIAYFMIAVTILVVTNVIVCGGYYAYTKRQSQPVT